MSELLFSVSQSLEQECNELMQPFSFIFKAIAFFFSFAFEWRKKLSFLNFKRVICVCVFLFVFFQTMQSRLQAFIFTFASVSPFHRPVLINETLMFWVVKTCLKLKAPQFQLLQYGVTASVISSERRRESRAEQMDLIFLKAAQFIWRAVTALRTTAAAIYRLLSMA